MSVFWIGAFYALQIIQYLCLLRMADLQGRIRKIDHNNRYKNNLELIKDAFHRNKIQKEPTEAAEKKDYISEILEDLNEHSKKIEKIVLLKKKEEKRNKMPHVT